MVVSGKTPASTKTTLATVYSTLPMAITMPACRTDGRAASPKTPTPKAMKNALIGVLEGDRRARDLGEPAGQRDTGDAHRAR